jgi:hypothetical protein
MSDVELTKFEILRDVDHERLPVHAAAGILGVSEGYVWRLLKAHRICGADGRIAIRYQREDLAYRTFDKIRKVNQAAVVENKRLGSQLDMIKAYHDTQPQEQRSRKARKRRDQTGHMFNVG